MTERYTLAKGIVCTCGRSCGHGPGIGFKMSQVDTEGWNVTLLCVLVCVHASVCLCVCLVGGQHGLGLALSPRQFLSNPSTSPHSGAKRSKQKEERGSQGRVLRELHADPGGGGAHREGAQGSPGDLPGPLPAGQVHYGMLARRGATRPGLLPPPLPAPSS